MSLIRHRGLVVALVFAGLLCLRPPARSNPLQVSGLNTPATVEETKGWGRDPFYRKRVKKSLETVAPFVEKRQEDFDLFLSAIIFREGIGVAIIDGKIVRLGDSVGKGYVVSHILNDKVLLLKGDRVKMLQVQPFRGK